MSDGHCRLAALLLLLIVGCSSVSEEGASDTGRDEFVAASDAWAMHGAGYTMAYTSTCGDGPTFTDIETTVVVTEDGNATVLDGPDGITPLTVGRVFELIAAALDEADAFEASYGELGNPVAVNIDWEINSIDDEFCIDVSDLQLKSD